MLLRYLPFAAAGFALARCCRPARAALSTRFCVENEILPTGAWTMPVLSTRNSTLPALISLDRLARRSASRCRSSGSASGRAGRAPCRACRPRASCRASRRPRRSPSSRPGSSRRARRRRRSRRRPPAASFCLSAPAITSTAWSCRGRAAARRCRAPSGRRASGSTPRRSDSSTVSSNFANFTFCTSGIASSIGYGRSCDLRSCGCEFLPVFAHVLPPWCKRARRPSHSANRQLPID